MDYLVANLDTYLKTDEVWIDGKAYKIPESVLKKCFINYDEFGRIKSKDQILIDLKEKRSNLQKLRYQSKLNVLKILKAIFGVGKMDF